MTFRHPSLRWALWVFAAALLLKAAMPMLASASAQAQGKAVVEICTVYGVSLVALDGQDPEQNPAPTTDHLADHGNEHCALSALTALVEPPMGLVPALPAVHPAEPVARELARLFALDASAAWVARLKHGPPALA